MAESDKPPLKTLLLLHLRIGWRLAHASRAGQCTVLPMGGDSGWGVAAQRSEVVDQEISGSRIQRRRHRLPAQKCSGPSFWAAHQADTLSALPAGVVFHKQTGTSMISLVPVRWPTATAYSRGCRFLPYTFGRTLLCGLQVPSTEGRHQGVVPRSREASLVRSSRRSNDRAMAPGPVLPKQGRSPAGRRARRAGGACRAPRPPG
jgi:hypothetical protein